jgi:hypothetical protein
MTIPTMFLTVFLASFVGAFFGAYIGVMTYRLAHKNDVG